MSYIDTRELKEEQQALDLSCANCGDVLVRSDAGWEHEHGAINCQDEDGNDLIGGAVAEPDDDEDAARWVEIEELRDEIGDEFDHGVLLIPDDEFEDYARELAEDIGAIDREAGWPTGCIDWKRAADELRIDYTSVTFDGTDYLCRA